MQSSKFRRRLISFTMHDLVYVVFFILSIGFKIYSSNHLPVNTYEGLRLIQLAGISSDQHTLSSLLESLLVKSSFFLFGTETMAARIWPIIAGSSLFLLPLYLKQKINWRQGFIFATLLMLDPFFTANSVQVGSNIFSVAAFAYLLASAWKKDLTGLCISVCVILLSGSGSIYGLVLIMGIYFSPWVKHHHEIEELKKEISNLFKNSFGNKKSLVIILIFILLLGLFGINVSQLFSESILLSHTENLLKKRPSIILMVVSLPIYLPLFFTILFTSIRKIDVRRLGGFSPFIISFIFVFIFAVVNPDKEVFDLVWMSIPVLIFSTLALEERMENNAAVSRRDMLISLGFLIFLFSLSLSLGQFVYAGFLNLSQTNAFLGIITSILLLAILGIFAVYFFGKKILKAPFVHSLLIIFLIFQTSMVSRTIGLGSTSALEPVFPGKKTDAGFVLTQLTRKSYTKEFVEEVPTIASISLDNPALQWTLNDLSVEQFPSHLNPVEEYEFVITPKEDVETIEPYRGQEFIIDNYPAWTNQPMRSLSTYDYWSWIFTRDAEMITETAILWMRN